MKKTVMGMKAAVKGKEGVLKIGLPGKTDMARSVL